MTAIAGTCLEIPSPQPGERDRVRGTEAGNLCGVHDLRFPSPQPSPRDTGRGRTLACIAALIAAGCGSPDSGPRTAGDPKAGRAAIERYQCGVCHDIPGVTQAEGTVGPPLTAYSRRVYIAGKLPQDSALLARWIRNAPSLAPATAMPATGVTEAEALDIVAYLYRLH
jgi:cytochrome c1